MLTMTAMLTMICNPETALTGTPQHRSLKTFLLVSIEPFVEGARDTEKYVNPDIPTLVKVAIKGSRTDVVYYNGILSGRRVEGAQWIFRPQTEIQHEGVQVSVGQQIQPAY